MNFLEIFDHACTNLPIEQNVSNSFLQTLTKTLGEFGSLIDASDNLWDAHGFPEFNQEMFKERNRVLRAGILETVRIYYQGNPSQAYEKLSDTLTTSNLRGYLDKEWFLPDNSQLFRLRVHPGNFALPKTGLFHIPFELRGKVQTQRFSIPGLPMLYLANSTYVAWEEMRRPGFDNIQAARLSNTVGLQFLDLTTDIYIRHAHINNIQDYGLYLVYKLMVWPLAAACSIKVLHPHDPFKPEYIIPQLLLQWIDKHQLAGIRYSSTHIDLLHQSHEGSFYNLAIPVKNQEQETGYCSTLVQNFKITAVLPMQLRQFASTADQLFTQPGINRYVNPDIDEIELIKGYRQPYFTTSFGVLEHSLKGLPLEDLIEGQKVLTH